MDVIATYFTRMPSEILGTPGQKISERVRDLGIESILDLEIEISRLDGILLGLRDELSRTLFYADGALCEALQEKITSAQAERHLLGLYSIAVGLDVPLDG